MVRRFRSGEKLSVLLQFLGAKGYSAKDYRFFNSDFPKKDVSECPRSVPSEISYGISLQVTTLDESKSFSELRWPVREQIFIEER